MSLVTRLIRISHVHGHLVSGTGEAQGDVHLLFAIVQGWGPFPEPDGTPGLILASRSCPRVDPWHHGEVSAHRQKNLSTSAERDHATTVAKEREMHRWSRSLMQGQHPRQREVVTCLHRREQKHDDNDILYANKQDALHAPLRHIK